MSSLITIPSLLILLWTLSTTSAAWVGEELVSPSSPVYASLLRASEEEHLKHPLTPHVGQPQPLPPPPQMSSPPPPPPPRSNRRVVNGRRRVPVTPSPDSPKEEGVIRPKKRVQGGRKPYRVPTADDYYPVSVSQPSWLGFPLANNNNNNNGNGRRITNGQRRPVAIYRSRGDDRGRVLGGDERSQIGDVRSDIRPEIEEGRPSPNPPEFLPIRQPDAIEVNYLKRRKTPKVPPKYYKKRKTPKGQRMRSSAIVESEEVYNNNVLTPRENELENIAEMRPYGNDMLYYPESNDDKKSNDLLGEDDPNADFVIIR